MSKSNEHFPETEQNIGMQIKALCCVVVWRMTVSVAMAGAWLGAMSCHLTAVIRTVWPGHVTDNIPLSLGPRCPCQPSRGHWHLHHTDWLRQHQRILQDGPGKEALHFLWYSVRQASNRTETVPEAGTSDSLGGDPGWNQTAQHLCSGEIWILPRFLRCRPGLGLF